MPTREISSRDVFLPHAVNYGKSIDTQTIIFAWHLVAYFLLVSHEGQAMTFFSETKKKEILSTSCELQGGAAFSPRLRSYPSPARTAVQIIFFFKKVVSVVRLLWHWQSDSIRVLFTASSFFVYFRVKHPTIRQLGMLWRSY
jgi:hypothetical protein